MSNLKYRRERQPDGSVKTTTSSYPSTLRVCQTCEWCKQTGTKNNEEISCILTCHLLFNQPYRVCGVYKREVNGKSLKFVPTIPAAELNDSPSWGLKENKCGNYMPFGWHYEKEEKEYLDYLDKKNPFEPIVQSHPAWIME